jgi:hypothetical protein
LAASFTVFLSEWKNGLLFTAGGLGLAFLLGLYWLSLDRFLGLLLGQSWQWELGLVRGRFFCGGDGSFLGQSRRIALNTLRRDNDRIGEPFGAGLFSQQLVGLWATGALQSDFLQLLLQFFFGQLAAF